MASAEHLNILRQGRQSWNEWRHQATAAPTPDLSHAGLKGTDLRGFDFTSADLRGTNLHYADLREAKLYKAVLRDAYLRKAETIDTDFRGADLRGSDCSVMQASGANLYDADLRKANLSGADLSGANLESADIRGTDLSEARFNQTNFAHARLWGTVFGTSDLSVAVGLDTAIHDGPSIVGIDALYRSGGQIPAKFLRGAGVPDEFIVYMKSLVVKPIAFYSCFISYSTKNQEFADRLHADLQSTGVRCWFAPHDMQSGRKMHDQIDQAIRLYDRLLLILSEHSMSSEWVKMEIAHARQKELNERRQVLFPISLVPFSVIQEWKCFDADTGKDSAREIREYFIPDFSNWNAHNSYDHAFQRLVRDLKAKEKVSAKADER